MPSSGVQTCALDRKSTRLNSSHGSSSYAVFCLQKKTCRERQPRAPRAPRRPALLDQQPAAGAGPRATAGLVAGVGELYYGDRPFFFFLKEAATPKLPPLPPPAPLPT